MAGAEEHKPEESALEAALSRPYQSPTEFPLLRMLTPEAETGLRQLYRRRVGIEEATGIRPLTQPRVRRRPRTLRDVTEGPRTQSVLTPTNPSLPVRGMDASALENMRRTADASEATMALLADGFNQMAEWRQELNERESQLEQRAKSRRRREMLGNASLIVGIFVATPTIVGIVRWFISVF